jgi:hypothetical protein
MDVTACPQAECDLPEEILDRMLTRSTHGPVEHARLVCLGGHRFFMPTEMLPGAQSCLPGDPRFEAA